MKRVLVVEDQELNLDLLVQLLEERYEVVTATDGASGIALARRLRPDAILMDLSLPVLDGWEAIRQLKASAQLKRIPVIVLTAHAMAGDEQRARACGCDDYLTKPIDESLLFATLEQHLGADSDAQSRHDTDSRR
jgi:two-component system cell cycle response regulator DivK